VPRAVRVIRSPGELGVERPGLRRGPELAEDDAVQQPGITGRDRAGLFGGEHYLMPGLTQQLPRHRDLRDVKVPVRKRNQHAHPAIIAARAACGYDRERRQLT